MNDVRKSEILAPIIVALVVLALFVFLLSADQKKPEPSALVVAYQDGKLETCAGVVERKIPHDIAVELDSEDTRFIKDYLVSRGVTTQPSDKILFIHVPINGDDIIEPRFQYYTVTQVGTPPYAHHCIDGGLSGILPFNEKMYKKYKE